MSPNYEILQRTTASAKGQVGHMKTNAIIFMDDFIGNFPRPMKEKDEFWINCSNRAYIKIFFRAYKLPDSIYVNDFLFK